MSRTTGKRSRTAELRERMRQHRNPNHKSVVGDERIHPGVRLIIGILLILTAIFVYMYNHGLYKEAASWLPW